MIPTYIIIHHSLTEDGKTVTWPLIRDYHMLSCGMHDIGYHYGIEKVNNRYEILKGRMDTEIGAHCIGFNEKSLGICMVGNFDNVRPDEPGLQLLLKLCRALIQVHTIPVEHVIGHWETYPLRNRNIEKSCPGILFSMPTFRSLL